MPEGPRGGRVATALLALLASTACGDALVDGDLEGTPVLELLLRVGVGPHQSPTMRVALVWAPSLDALDQQQWQLHGPELQPLPAEDFTLRLFDPPPVPSGVGRLLAYDRPDGRWVPDTPLYAVGDAVVLYTAESGYVVRHADDLCCGDVAACARTCTGDCRPPRSLLALMPDTSPDDPCPD